MVADLNRFVHMALAVFWGIFWFFCPANDIDFSPKGSRLDRVILLLRLILEDESPS
jgi:hypothetical protein